MSNDKVCPQGSYKPGLPSRSTRATREAPTPWGGEIAKCKEKSGSKMTTLSYGGHFLSITMNLRRTGATAVSRASRLSPVPAGSQPARQPATCQPARQPCKTLQKGPIMALQKPIYQRGDEPTRSGVLPSYQGWAPTGQSSSSCEDNATSPVPAPDQGGLSGM